MTCLLHWSHYHVVCNQPKILKKLNTAAKIKIYLREQTVEYFAKSTATVLQYWLGKSIAIGTAIFFAPRIAIRGLLLEYVLPVLLTTLLSPNMVDLILVHTSWNYTFCLFFITQSNGDQFMWNCEFFTCCSW